ncbi:MAG TPA: DPP IV N-terminal domain-containing protein [Steroidobacteraceae bacterium]|jgi:dipeptidyl aminopeptidase/acylaminoacyl peptidase|nr:DPP IV N-terminal domain-containing protein [Steroidobacteraceae bacterium]
MASPFVRVAAWAVIGLGLLIATAMAGTPAAVTDADYARAERLMPYNTNPLVLHSVSDVTWLGDGDLTYRATTAQGSEVFLVDPRRGTSRRAANQASALPAPAAPNAANEARSPDGQWAVFIRNDNLWVRRLATEETIQLTFDGVKDFGYATDNSGWHHSDRAVVSWSPDSRRIATYQQDQRGVADMYVVRTGVGHPVLEAWKYAMPGDKVVPTLQRVVIDVAARRLIRLQMPPDQRRTAHCYDLNCGPDGSMTDVQWSPDGSRLAFVSVSRDHKVAWLRIADAATGAVRDVLREQVATFYESASGWAQDAVNWRYLPASHEAIWFSQRDDREHLYLYDARTGKLKNRITNGNWNVIELLQVDLRHRVLYLLGAGREPGNPYFCYLYKVGFDGRHLQLLTPERANHVVSMAPSGRYFLDSFSTADTPPVTVLKDSNGHLIRTLEKADVSRLHAIGWRPPMPITVKARDGVTSLYGLLYRPTDFAPDKKYPVIDRIYPGPQIGSVGGFGFESARGDSQAMAELGFIVVAIDGMGTSLRSKRFQDAYHGDLSDGTLPDQVAGLRELARRYAWIDLTRVGIYGHSGGAYASVTAMLHYPQFFKVGVAESGNYDQRGYEGDWGEQYIGLLQREPGGTSNYDSQDATRLAGKLQGHLLLMDGTTDDNVPPYLTTLLVQALIHANKDFDLVLLPDQRHMYRGAARLYAARRRWDYYVRHLLGAQPPHEYALHPPAGAPLGSEW